MDTVIKVDDGFKGKGVGTKLFSDAMAHFGRENVKMVRGNWHAGEHMSDNFDEYKRLRETLSPEDAARNTFTGKRARDHGFNNVKVVDDNASSVLIEFS